MSDDGAFHEGALLQALWNEAARELPHFGVSPTTSYGDFLDFHAKFCAFQQRQRAARDDSRPATKLPSSRLQLDEHRLGERSARNGRDGEWARRPDAAAQLGRAKLALEHFCDFVQKKQAKQRAQIDRDRSQLPIANFQARIVSAVRDNQVVVLAGDTGCGKSTQVPQYLLQAGCDRLVVTQPRRISAVSLSRRVALETHNEFGSKIAHQIRFDSSRASNTRCIFMTEGVLLRQAVSDCTLSQYDVIVLDEVHERHVSTDLLLGLLKGQVLPSAPNIRVVLMSATVNVNLFAQYFSAPVMQIPGRLHPIKVEYCPPKNAADVAARAGTQRRYPQLDPTPYLQLMQRIDHQYSSAERGDVLVFVGGMDDISRVCDAARGYAQLHGGWVVLPLHSSLATEEQDRVFDMPPEGVRKLIVSTNIAETSVTIDGIRFVIDSGLEKEMRYDPESGVRRLMVTFVSKASAEQRKGRAGRTGPGVCFRLYSEQDFEERFDAFSTPEVQRMNLDSTLLQIIAQGQDPRDFPFIDPPAPEAIAAALASLEELGAIVDLEEQSSEQEEPSTSQLTCTALGTALSLLPVDLSAGKMLLLSTVFDYAAPALRSLTTIAAALSVQSPIQRRRDELGGNSARDNDTNEVADRQRLQNSFDSQHGDPFTLLNCFDDWMWMKRGRRKTTRRSSSKGSETHAWCKRHGLQENRLYEIAKLQQQFQQMLRDAGLSKATGTHSADADRRRDDAQRRRQLRELQLTVDRQRGRRVLQLDDGGDVEEVGESGESGSLVLDVRHLDFELSYKLDAPSQIGRELSTRDCNLMKLIIAASVYPNFAIADEHNEGKKPSDACFHTRFKQFVKLHPSSPTAADPAGACGPGELICFTHLLETNHAYLVHPMPVLALHTLLLFSKSVHTDETCTRIVCDGWLQLHIRNSGTGERLLLIAHQLRLLWDQLLHEKLSQRRSHPGSGKESGPKQKKTTTRQNNSFDDGSMWHQDRVGDPMNLQNKIDTDTRRNTDRTDPQRLVPPVRVPLIPDSELAKMPKFAQHIYQLRHLPTKTGGDGADAAHLSTTQQPDELLAGKLAAFLAVPVSYSVERAKLSELAVELGLRKERNLEKDFVGLRESKAKQAVKADSMAMQNLEAAQQLSRDSRTTGVPNTMAVRSQLGSRRSVDPHDKGSAKPLHPIAGHRLAAWLHYGSLRRNVNNTCDQNTPVKIAHGIHRSQASQTKSDLKDETTSAVDEMRHFLGLSEHIPKHWRCPRCEQVLLVNLAGARMHDRECRVLLRTIGTVDEAAVAHVAKKHKVGAQTDSGGVQQPARRRQQQQQEDKEEESNDRGTLPMAHETLVDERLGDGKRYFLVRASAKDRSVGLRRSANMDDCAPDGSDGLVKDGTVVEAVHETKQWVRLYSGLWLPKKFLRSVETFENVLRYQR